MGQGVFYTFWFEKNLQGDIIAIYNSTGTKIGTYTYDAWGYSTYSITSGISTLDRQMVYRYNPFRYRGYYYDIETGLYYLQSRYYNPEWGRFISADGYVSTGTGILGYNMFAYCNNNPVMRIDPTGEFWWIVALVVVVATTITLSGCSVTYQTSQNGQEGPTKEDDDSWVHDNPFLMIGRYENQEDAINEALDRTTQYAQTHPKEVGCFVYKQYGGYYVSSFQGNVSATDHSVLLDPSSLPKGVEIIADFHSHLFHNDNILYQTSEWRAVQKNGYPSYVADCNGWAYALFPDAENYMDYKIIRYGR